MFVPEALRRIGSPLDIGNALLALGAFEVLRRGTGGIVEQLRAQVQDRAFRAARTTCALAPPSRVGDLRAPSNEGSEGRADAEINEPRL